MSLKIAHLAHRLKRLPNSFQAWILSPDLSGTWHIIGCEFSRGTKGAHIILWNSNGDTCSRGREGRIHWMSLAGGEVVRSACGIRRFNHPLWKRDGDTGVLLVGVSRPMPCYWPACRPRPPGRDTAALMLQVKIEPRPGHTR